MLNSEKRWPIEEWFDSFQGEGSFVGLPVRFIRFGGCDYSLKVCPWCDSARASDNDNLSKWTMMTEVEIIVLFDETYRDIVLTGGNPLLYLSDMPFLKRFANRIHIETQGSLPLPWAVKHLVVSPKFDYLYENEQARETNEEFWDNLPEGQLSIDLKYPCVDIRDLNKIIKNFGDLLSKGIQTTPIATIRNDCTKTREWYADRCLEFYKSMEGMNAPSIILVQPQVHVLVFGNKKGV